MISTQGGPIQGNALVKTSEHPELGTILTEASGRTLYLFTMDERLKSNCSAGCALAWPPLLTVGDPTAEGDVTADKLGIISREDGYSQVTYNGSPLYYFAPDEKPGDTMGHGVGDVWFAVSSGGDSIAVSAPPPTAVSMEHPPTPAPTPSTIDMQPSPVTAPTATATSGPATPPTFTPVPSIGAPSAVQEVATIEDYAASGFYPESIVVIKDVPLKLSMTRLHSEHVNEFTIEPFLFGRAFASPGHVGVERFTPDRTGEFKMQNLGHFFEGDFVVVDSVEEAKKRIAAAGMQEFSLIHDLGGGRLIPGRIVVQKGIPVRIYNTSLKGDDRVSIEPFYAPEEVNVRERKITTFEFIPDTSGEFMIRYENHDFTGVLVVE